MQTTAKKSVCEVAISEFKAKCFSLLDEVRKTKIPLRVTRRGKANADVIPSSPALGEKDRIPPSSRARYEYPARVSILHRLDCLNFNDRIDYVAGDFDSTGHGPNPPMIGLNLRRIRLELQNELAKDFAIDKITKTGYLEIERRKEHPGYG